MEIIYKIDCCNKSSDIIHDDIRWLGEKDRDCANEFLRACKTQALFSVGEFSDLEAKGIMYCGLFKDGKLLSAACVEKYSDDCWDVSDVRTLVGERNKGYGRQVVSFVVNYIFDNRKAATSYTNENNYPMRRILEALGFTIHMISDDVKGFYSI